MALYSRDILESAKSKIDILKDDFIGKHTDASPMLRLLVEVVDLQHVVITRHLEMFDSLIRRVKVLEDAIDQNDGR